MRSFFRHIDRRNLAPEDVAARYGKHLWRPRQAVLVDQEKLSRSRYNVALAISDGADAFEWVTKRATLVSDTLLLTHDDSGVFHPIGMSRNNSYYSIIESFDSNYGSYSKEPPVDYADQVWFGMHCPDLAALGKWILDARSLLTAGCVWYLPRYASGRRTGEMRPRQTWEKPSKLWGVTRLTGADYLIKDGRAVDVSGAEPIKSQLVHPILSIDLPFLEGIDLHTFSTITIQEFASYSAFRDFLRQAFLEMDEAMNSDQVERELFKLGLQIRDQIRGVESEMRKTRTKRAVSASGAVIASISAVLVAVYGPAMQAAIATLGVSGGLWGIIHAVTENNTRSLRENKWYYVWALTEKTGGGITQ